LYAKPLLDNQVDTCMPDLLICRLGWADRGEGDAVVGMELDHVEPARSGGILVLLADRLAAHVELDLAGLAAQIELGLVGAPEGIERVQQPDGEGARRAHAAPARGDVGDRGDFHARGNAHLRQSSLHQDMLDLARVADDLGARVGQADAFLETAVDGDVDELVDRGAEHRAALFAVIGRQIAAPADETQAQGRFADDHRYSTGRQGQARRYATRSSINATASRRLGATKVGCTSYLPSRPPKPV